MTSLAGESRKAQVRRQNRQVILSAAEHVFAQIGFTGATMAQIARLAGLPKANLHYYFGTKDELYRTVLEDILSAWQHELDGFTVDADPRAAVSAYVRAKLAFSRYRPSGSKVFADEIIHGAGVIGSQLTPLLCGAMDEKFQVIEHWAAQKIIAPVDGRHFFLILWGITQHYADFEMQVRAVLGRKELTDDDWGYINGQVEAFVLRALGLIP